jgi:hypothetical protein
MLYQEIHTYRKIKILFKRVPDDQTFIVSGMGVTMEDGKKPTRNKTSLSSRGNLYVTEEGVIGRKRNTSDKKS